MLAKTTKEKEITEASTLTTLFGSLRATALSLVLNRERIELQILKRCAASDIIAKTNIQCNVLKYERR